MACRIRENAIKGAGKQAPQGGPARVQESFIEVMRGDRSLFTDKSLIGDEAVHWMEPEYSRWSVPTAPACTTLVVTYYALPSIDSPELTAG